MSFVSKLRVRGICAASSACMALAVCAAPAFASYAAENYAVYPNSGESNFNIGSYVPPSRGLGRSSAEWDALEDNTLLWEEIPSLIHEYNATVITNRTELAQDERKAMDAGDLSDWLLDAAEDMYSAASDAEEMSAALAASYRSQGDSLRQQAESNLNDFDIIRLNYEQIEKKLYLSAKNQFINYYKAKAQDEYNTDNLSYLERAYNSAQNQFNVQMATELDVLTAKETWDNAKAGALINSNSISDSYRGLIVLCGWKYNADVQLGSLPVINVDEIKMTNFESDRVRAEAVNFTLLMDNIRLNNARYYGTDSGVSQQENQLKSDTDSFNINFKSAYDSLISAADAYTNAVNAKATGDQNLENSRKQRELGLISDMELATAENTNRSLGLTVTTSYYDLLSAKAAYDAAVNDGVL